MTALRFVVRTVLLRRELIRELATRELRDRHAGQILGVLWAYGHPLLLMLIYTGLFAYVFPARTGRQGALQDYSACVFAGIVPWLAFQDLLARSPSVLVAHANLVKQIVFPTEVLPIKAAIASAMPYSVGVIFAVAYAGWHGTLSWFTLALPLVIVCQLAAMVGSAFALSACGVFLRDIRDIVTVFCSINLFAQPILYDPFATPKWMGWVFRLNPFSYLTWCWQDALFFGGPAHAAAWIVLPLVSLVVLAGGALLFERSRHWFGDAL